MTGRALRQTSGILILIIEKDYDKEADLNPIPVNEFYSVYDI